MLFVWCYCKETEKDNELDLSIHSVRKFFQGKAEILVIGDRPACMNLVDTFIECPRVGFQQLRSNVDVINKLDRLLMYPNLPDTFVWMMDDIHFINPITMDDLCTLRYQEDIPEKKPIRAGLKQTTRELLEDMGYYYLDYATHAPHFINVEYLIETLDVVRSHLKLSLWETVYECMWQPPDVVAEPVTPFLVRVLYPHMAEQRAEYKKDHKVLNHNDPGFSPELKQWLEQNVCEQ